MNSMRIEEERLEYRLLDHQCNRRAFSCGEAELDRWFRDKAANKHAKYLCRVTTVHLAGNNVAAGFYGLSLHSEPTNILDKIQRRIGWETSVFPAVHLTHLAVQRSMQGAGIGQFLLSHAILRVYYIAQVAGVFALTLNPLMGRDGFYLRKGFRPYGHSGGMLLPIQSIIDLVEQNA
jgi:GNAT superfamily N-acetyltransferase